MERIDYDFSKLDKESNSLMQVFGALEVAMRQSDLAWEVRDYLKSHPNAAVINLGCGLDNTSRACDNGSCKIYNIDLSDVIELRNRLLPAEARERNLALDLNDPAWLDAIDTDPVNGTVLFAAGVFYYFTTQQMQRLITAMAKRFPGGRLVFDGAGKTAVKLMLKTWVKQAGIKDVGAYFSVKDAKRELERWSPLLSVSSRGYMQGYRKLAGPGVKPIHRLLATIADGPLHIFTYCFIVRDASQACPSAMPPSFPGTCSFTYTLNPSFSRSCRHRSCKITLAKTPPPSATFFS